MVVIFQVVVKYCKCSRYQWLPVGVHGYPSVFAVVLSIREHPPWVSVGVRMCSVVLGIFGYLLVSVLICSSPEYPWVSVASGGIRMQS